MRRRFCISGLVFQLIQPLAELAVRGYRVAHPHERAHHVDGNLDRTWRIDHRRRHDGAVLGERQRRLAHATPA
ncbi:MAG: hypothetical protein AABM33_07800 [Pseudomonadota bacterium]